MIFNRKATQEPEKLDRQEQHDMFFRTVERWISPDRELALSIMPPSCDPEWELGYHKVYCRCMEEVIRFKSMYAVMQAQRPERRLLRAVERD